jgi:hypothetical protein
MFPFSRATINTAYFLIYLFIKKEDTHSIIILLSINSIVLMPCILMMS